MNVYFDQFMAEAKSLSGRPLILKHGPRFVNIGYTDNKVFYTYAKVEIATGDIYSQSGTKPRGNILTEPYHGIDIINEYGVIINDNAYSKRLQTLRGEISFEQASQMIQQGQIVNFVIKPLLQFGIQQGNSKVTLIDNTGREWDVVALYQPITNEIYPPNLGL